MEHSYVNGVSQERACDPLMNVNLNVLPAFHIAGAASRCPTSIRSLGSAGQPMTEV